MTETYVTVMMPPDCWTQKLNCFLKPSRPIPYQTQLFPTAVDPIAFQTYLNLMSVNAGKRFLLVLHAFGSVKSSPVK